MANTIEGNDDGYEQFIVDGEEVLWTLPELLSRWNVISEHNNMARYIRIPYLTNEVIERFILSLSNSFYVYGKLDEERLCNYIIDKYGYAFSEADLGMYGNINILGQTDFKKKQIRISNALKDNPGRRRFTLAHEIGHLMLHGNVLNEYMDENTDDEHTLNIKNRERLEIQANCFASQLLLPSIFLENALYNYYEQIGLSRRGALYYDNQPCNQGLRTKKH